MSNPASLAQIHAARPTHSTWVSANAGSGKTRVLTNRVARLLLNGAEPHRILCVTYTKAAAAEMQSRLFAELGEWAMMPRAKLVETLEALGEDGQILSDNKLATARRLFAQALETPGGLKIQTIHAFCGSLLRQFPLEAGVSPGFRELDGLQARQVQTEVLDALAETDENGLFSNFAYQLGDGDISKLLGEILTHRRAFRQAPEIEDYEAALGAERGLILPVMLEDLFETLGRETLLDWASVLMAGKTTDQAIANGIRSYLTDRDPNHLVFAVLTKGLTVRARLGTADIKKRRPDIPEDLRKLGEACAEIHQRYHASQMVTKCAVLVAFATAFLAHYEARKAQLGVLDFDDLIERSGALLTNPEYGAWVLYRLDGGLDHVLIDEAQDTSPPQWELVKSLTEAFFDGEGASLRDRTLFVVGDKKQSIYSFQGADPRVFDEMRSYFSERLAPVSEGLVDSELLYSFRTAPPILRLVDAVMAADEGQKIEHRAFHETRPGRVELWPFVEMPDLPEETPWYDPIDMPSPDDPEQMLAHELADFVRQLLESRAILPGTSRVVEPRDFLFLVRSRGQEGQKNRIFNPLIQALKAAGVPVAGSDRLNVSGELAVRDLLSLLRFAVTSNDDLALAEALRSPLFGLSEGDLFKLAHGRQGTLIYQLGQRPEFAEPHAVLTRLMEAIDFDRPFELLDNILNRLGGRQKLVARLGAEVEDGIDELMAQALSYEESEPPTISGFLDWIAGDDSDVKRQSDDTRNEVRVMTVHGAKGLEAPIVILPDTGKRDVSKNAPQVQTDESGLPFWMIGGSAFHPPHVTEIEAERRLRAQAEDDRLLYVAMTRAERWLIVAGFGSEANKDPDSWYGRVRTGMLGSGASSEIVSDGTLLALDMDWIVEKGETAGEVVSEQVRMPEWLKATVGASPGIQKPLSPSDLGGAHALVSEETDIDLMQRGTDLHRLLEKLPDYPEEDWEEVAIALIGEDDPSLPVEARKTLTASYCVPVFDPSALREVPISGTLEQLGMRPLSGIIDRLIVMPDAVWAVDFKSNRTVPEKAEYTPEALKRQMGAYLGLLEQIYPDRNIHVALLWTVSQQLMELSHEDVNAALLRAATS